MSSIVKAITSGSLFDIQSTLKDPEGINDEFQLDDKNYYPITWACYNELITLVEMLAKCGADPNKSFKTQDNRELLVLDWACEQNIGSLVEILLKCGAIATPTAYKISLEKNQRLVLSALTNSIKDTIKNMYKSHVYQAYDSKLIDYNTDNLYIFAFHMGQANFLCVRRNNKVVIVDCGENGGSLNKQFREANKDHMKTIEELKKVISAYNKFRECPGKVKKMFTTNSRANPKDEFRAALDAIRKNGTTEQLNMMSEIEKMSIDDKDLVIDKINEVIRISEELEKVKQRQEFFLVFNDSEVEYVFVTHSHDDHYNFIDNMIKYFPKSFEKTQYLFGGNETDWKGKTVDKVFDAIGREKIKYTGREYSTMTFNLLNGLEVKVHGQDSPDDADKDKNQISLFVTIDINGKRVLFTGDAEGCHLRRLRIEKPNDADEKTKLFLDEIEKLIKEKRLSRENCTKEVYEKLKEFKDNSDIEEIVKNMLNIEEVLLVFEPHHGSLTKNSHDIYKYLSVQDTKKVFCIMSYPMSMDYLPKRESVENRVAEPKTREHPVVFAVDEIPTMNVTTDPVYTTGACCDNMYVFSFSNDKDEKFVKLLNLTNEVPEWEDIKYE